MMISKILRFLVSCAFFLLALLAFPSYVSAETGNIHVKVRLLDQTTEEPVGFATVSLTQKGEKRPLKYVLSSSEGNADFDKVRKGTYILKAEIMGYKPFEQEIVVETTVDLGDVHMGIDAELIDAAGVTAVGNPIIVKKDTIEYNANSFKVTDNDMLEALLKKLPGVEVASDGSVTANGEPIKKITIDGKTFFLNDPQLAVKNIPAKMVDKVKVVERKSEQAQFTGIFDGETETIMDLSLRPGMLNGIFGNVMAGGGHDLPDKGYYNGEKKAGDEGWRYQGAAMGGRFTKKSQISVILNGNNTNNRGFDDMSSSMMSSMRGGMKGMGRGMSRGGGFGGGSTGNGITSSWMAGANGAFTLLDERMDLSGNYLYTGSDKFVEEESSRLTFMDDGSTLLYDNDGFNRSTSHGHRFGIRLEHKFSENTSIIFEPQVNFGKGHFNEYTRFLTERETGTAVDTANTGFNENFGKNSNWNAQGYLLFRQRLGKPGRTVSVNLRYNFKGNGLDGFNQSRTLSSEKTGGPGAGGRGKTEDVVNQRFDQISNGSSISARAVYTEPLYKDMLFMEASYSFQWNRNRSWKNVYDSASDDLLPGNGHLAYQGDGESFNDIYSNDIVNRYITHWGALNLMYQKNKFSSQIGVSANPTLTHNVTNGVSYDNTTVNWSPQASVMYYINDNTKFNAYYYGYLQQPSTSQLMPVPDNADPLNVSFGNPYLKPYFNNNLRVYFAYTDKRTFTAVHSYLGGGIVQNGIVRANWYDDRGAQYSIPVNGPGSGNVDFRLMVNVPVAKSGFSIFSMTYARYNEASSYVGTGRLNTTDYYDRETEDFDYGRFNADFMDNARLGLFDRNRTQSVNFMERLRFTYRNDIVELMLGGSTSLARSWHSITVRNQKTTWNNRVDFSMNWTIPGGVGIVSDLKYNWYRGYASPQEDEFIFNAEISKLLCKKKLTLAVKAYDILNQAKNLYVSDASNYHQEVRNNTLGRYVILSLTYRFGTFDKSGKGGPYGSYHGGPHGGPRGGGRPH